MKKRCTWAGEDPLYIAYHDEEWGVPSHDDTHLFEMLVLEGAQAGLSWWTILRKRENYRKDFAGFDATKVARFDAGRRTRLMADPGIVRNRAKIEGAVRNAKEVVAIRREFGSFDAYIWRFVEGRPVRNAWTSVREIPAETAASRAMSRSSMPGGSGSWVRQSVTRSCKPWAWSTTT